MSRRPLGNNTQTGVQTWWHQDGEGNWAVEKVQDVDGILDLNRYQQNHGAPYTPLGAEMQHVARIPLIVIELWRNKYGVDYWNPDHQGKVDKLLNDSEWCWLRTGGRV